MNNVFKFRDQLIGEYSEFSRSFSKIAAVDIKEEVERQYSLGRYWPEPLVQINPNYQRKGTVQLDLRIPTGNGADSSVGIPNGRV